MNYEEMIELAQKEAAKMTDIVIGIAVLALVVIAGAVLWYTAVYTRSEKAKRMKLKAKMEAAIQKAVDDALLKQGAKYFAELTETKDKLKIAQAQKEQVEKKRDYWKREYDRLRDIVARSGGSSAE